MNTPVHIGRGPLHSFSRRKLILPFIMFSTLYFFYVFSKCPISEGYLVPHVHSPPLEAQFLEQFLSALASDTENDPGYTATRG